jgi:LacI family transcriptional regulator
MRDPVFAEILFGCSEVAKEHGYQLIESMLSQRGYDLDEELKAIQTLIAKRVDGLSLQSEHEDWFNINSLRQCPVPCVFINRHPQGLDFNFVTHDHEYGCYLAANHLLSKGRRNICFIVRYPNTSCVRARIKGCKNALAEQGLPENALTIIECGDTLKEAYDKTYALLQSNGHFDAIIAWEDIMAVGVIRALLDRNYRVPEDIAVVGYNDIEMAAYVSPPLTTIRQKITEIGETAAKIMIEQLESDRNVEQHIVIKPELVIRKTT